MKKGEKNETGRIIRKKLNIYTLHTETNAR